MQVKDTVAQPSPPTHTIMQAANFGQKTFKRKWRRKKQAGGWGGGGMGGSGSGIKDTSFQPAQPSEPSSSVLGHTSSMQVQPQHLLSQTAHVALNL